MARDLHREAISRELTGREHAKISDSMVRDYNRDQEDETMLKQ